MPLKESHTNQELIDKSLIILIYLNPYRLLENKKDQLLLKRAVQYGLFKRKVKLLLVRKADFLINNAIYSVQRFANVLKLFLKCRMTIIFS
jgi:hypothetical protein